MATLVPATLTWTSIIAEVSAFLDVPLVLGAVTFILALRVGPKVISTLKRVSR